MTKIRQANWYLCKPQIIHIEVEICGDRLWGPTTNYVNTEIEANKNHEVKSIIGRLTKIYTLRMKVYRCLAQSELLGLSGCIARMAE